MDAALRARYALEGAGVLAAELGIPYKRVLNRASYLGLKLDRSGPAFTAWRRAVTAGSARLRMARQAAEEMQASREGVCELTRAFWGRP
jgi:hypothetical protein